MAPKRHNSGKISLHSIKLDNNINFKSVGGLEEHKKCLREMIMFPLMYPKFFKRFDTQPPKGVLFHGPPGTGKTLMAKALANECSELKGMRVSFFVHKCADIMSKWYGESERHLKECFEQAQSMSPSIIFFDEIDALAPARAEVQGEAFASIVSTLLVEMDGLTNRGNVIVIGATNRPDCLDPALRRPGRLDRELYFPPPNILARREILSIHTRNWVPPPSGDTLDHLAKITSGYLGSDLSGLCSEAALRALRRVYPEVYNGEYSALATVARNVKVTPEDLFEAKRATLPASARYTCSTLAKQLPPRLASLMQAQVTDVLALVKQCFPYADPGFKSGDDDIISPSTFLLSGDCADTHIAPALLDQLEHCAVLELSIATLHSSAVAESQERALVCLFNECRRTEHPSILFVSNIPVVWEHLSGSGSCLFLELWKTRAAGNRTLLFATSGVRHDDLPDEELFPVYKDCSYSVRKPTSAEVMEFFEPVLTQIPPTSNDQKSGTPATDPMPCTSHSLTPHEAAGRESRKRRHGDSRLCLDYKRSKRDTAYPDENDRRDSQYENYQCHDICKFLRLNAEVLCRLGLEALIDLHGQFGRKLHVYSTSQETAKLHQDLYSTTIRYLKLAKKR